MISSPRQCVHTPATSHYSQLNRVSVGQPISIQPNTSLILRTDVYKSIGLFNLVGEFNFEVKAPIQPIYFYLILLARSIILPNIIKNSSTGS